MHLEKLALTLICVGAGLLVVAFVLPTAVGGRMVYSDEDAVEYQKAAAELHKQRHGRMHSGAEAKRSGGDYFDATGADHGHESAENNDELKAAEKRFEEVKATRDAATTRGRGTAFVMKWLGVLSAAAGVVVYFVNRSNEP